MNTRKLPAMANPSPELPMGIGSAALESRMLPDKALEKSAGVAKTISQNMALGLARVAINSIVALALPAYLTHRLPVTTYGAWVLILQLATYVSFLDLGIQTGVAKFVAEYKARRDTFEAGRHASAGLTLMIIAGVVGVLLTLVIAWQVPRLFQAMPAVLYRDVRIGVVLVGVSMSFGLVCSIFSAIFLGLQRYTVPMTIFIVNRLLFAVVVVIAVMLHGGLIAMGVSVAIVNVATALLQVIAWRKLASSIYVSIRLVDLRVLTVMTRYCFLLAIWTVGMVCVSGLDVTIVGHYDYSQTAYYSIATLPTNFVLAIISAMLGPIMPASSALSTQRSATEMGDLLGRATRYCTMLLLLTGLPLIVFGLPLLHLWVGPMYAISSLKYLRILVLANIIRSICQPYATMLAATGKQGAATAAAVSEAIVNLGSSIYLAGRFGAIGVALGTLLGAFVSVSLHFVVSMHYTRATLTISRARLFMAGLSRPAIIAIPSILLFPLWGYPSWKTFNPPEAVLWGMSTLLLAWFGNLNRAERSRLISLARERVTVFAGHG